MSTTWALLSSISSTNLSEPSAPVKALLKQDWTALIRLEFMLQVKNIYVTPTSEFLLQFSTHITNIINAFVPPAVKDSDFFAFTFKEVERTISGELYPHVRSIIDKSVEQYKIQVSKHKETANTYLTSFVGHCNRNKICYHSCKKKGRFIIGYENGVITYAICNACYEVFNKTYIEMYCDICGVNYTSYYLSRFAKENIPATWDQYHCPGVIPEQIRCRDCKGKLWIISDDWLHCKQCKGYFTPEESKTECKCCHEPFTSGIRVYSPLEEISVRNSIVTAVVQGKVVKPFELQCECKKSTEQWNFVHGKKCDGVMLIGYLNSNAGIVVCSKCYRYYLLDEYKWTCPCCDKEFITENLSTFTENFGTNSYWKAGNAFDFTTTNINESKYITQTYNNSSIKIFNMYTTPQRDETKGNDKQRQMTINLTLDDTAKKQSGSPLRFWHERIKSNDMEFSVDHPISNFNVNTYKTRQGLSPIKRDNESYWNEIMNLNNITSDYKDMYSTSSNFKGHRYNNSDINNQTTMQYQIRKGNEKKIRHQKTDFKLNDPREKYRESAKIREKLEKEYDLKVVNKEQPKKEDILDKRPIVPNEIMAKSRIIVEEAERTAGENIPNKNEDDDIRNMKTIHDMDIDNYSVESTTQINGNTWWSTIHDNSDDKIKYKLITIKFNTSQDGMSVQYQRLISDIKSTSSLGKSSGGNSNILKIISHSIFEDIDTGIITVYILLENFVATLHDEILSKATIFPWSSLKVLISQLLSFEEGCSVTLSPFSIVVLNNYKFKIVHPFLSDWIEKEAVKPEIRGYFEAWQKQTLKVIGEIVVSIITWNTESVSECDSIVNDDEKFIHLFKKSVSEKEYPREFIKWVLGLVHPEDGKRISLGKWNEVVKEWWSA